eukprot:scaffold2872_cov190-Chaetoceros_neogracile.AAC.1
MPITLKPSPEREVLDIKKAEAMVSSWRKELLAYQILNPDAPLCDRIILSNKSYTEDAITIIAEFLTSTEVFNPSISAGIKYAQLDDMIASRMEEEGLAVLTAISNVFENSQLIEVDLSDNAMGSKGVIACKMVIGGPAALNSMESLKLCNNGLSEYTMGEVAELLTDENGVDGSCIAQNLRCLHFYNNMSGNEGCESFALIMAKCSDKLEDIRMSGTRARAEGSAEIASSLSSLAEQKKLEKLTRLDLGDNSFGECFEDLASAIRACPQLTYLNLSDCVLGDEGVEDICNALLDVDAPLEYLNLGGNDITKDGAKVVAKLIQALNSTLVTFIADENCELTSKGIAIIAKAFNSQTVKEIKFNGTECGTIGADAIIAMKQNLPNLEILEIDDNRILEEAVERLTEVFGDILAEMEGNDDEEDADGDLSDDEDDDDTSVDDLAAAMANVAV